MSLFDSFAKIKVHIEQVETNLHDLENKGRKSAAPRARKSVQECRKLLMELRKEIMIHVKQMPTVKKTSKPVVVEALKSEVPTS